VQSKTERIKGDKKEKQKGIRTIPGGSKVNRLP